MPDRLLSSHGEVAQQNLGTCSHERGAYIRGFEIDRTESCVVRIVRHVRGYTVKHRTHLNDHIRHRQRALKHARAVRLCEDGLLERTPHLPAVDIEGGDKFDIAAAVSANGRAHDAVETFTLAVAIVFDALHQGTGTIANHGNGHFYVIAFRLRALTFFISHTSVDSKHLL